MGLRLLGIDPGFTSTGYAIIDVGRKHQKLLAAGVIHTKPQTRLKRVARGSDDIRRIAEIFKPLNAAIAEHKPDVAAIESIAGSLSARSATALGMGFSLAVGVCLSHGLEPLDFGALEVKEAATGSRNASKTVVGGAIKARFGGALWDKLLEPVARSRREHAYDAAGVALAALNHPTLKLAVGLGATK